MSQQSQRTYDANITSLWRQNDVAISFGGRHDDVIALCDCWDGMTDKSCRSHVLKCCNNMFHQILPPTMYLSMNWDISIAAKDCHLLGVKQWVQSPTSDQCCLIDFTITNNLQFYQPQIQQCFYKICFWMSMP